MSTGLAFYPYALRPRHVHNLPPEIITASFWHLSFTEVRYAAQVCQRWRDLGIDHPIFWRHIEATSATPGALELLRARVGQSDGRPFTFKVDVKGNTRAIEHDLIDIIGAALRNVRDLTVFLDILVMLDLFAMLKYPAPKLRRLHIKLYAHDGCISPIPLWTNILQNIPGELASVRLDDLYLPVPWPGYSAVIPSFAKVTSLDHCLPASASMDFPAQVFAMCPCLVQFGLRVGRVLHPRALAQPEVEAISRLKSIFIDIADTVSREEFISRVPLNAVKPVTIVGSLDFDCVYDLLVPLRSPFLLGFTEVQAAPGVFARHTFNIHVQDFRSGQDRVFTQYREHYARASDSEPVDESCINALLGNDDFYAQIYYLYCDASLWTFMAPHLHSYESVQAFALFLDHVPYMDSAAPYVLPRASFTFPKLRCLSLQTTTHDFICVDAQDIVDFVDRTAPSCTKLELRRVVVVGSFALLSERYDVVWLDQNV